MQEEIAVTLLHHLQAWRMRAIERIELSSALWSVREREIHVKPLTRVAAVQSDLPGHIPGFYDQLSHLPRENDGKVELLLPIAELPKVPLLDLHITVDQEPVYRIPLDEGARLEAAYIKYLAIKAGITVADFEADLEELLAAIFFLPTSQYGYIWKKYNQLSMDPRQWRHPMMKLLRRRDPLQIFLDAFLKFDIKEHILNEWREVSSKIRGYVLQETMEDYRNGAENPLIALPQMSREMERLGRGVLDETQCTRRLEALYSLLRDAHAQKSHTETEEARLSAKAASTLLSTYAAFGNRWTAFARCRIPVDRPFIITVKEKRSIYFQHAWHKRFKSSRFFPTAEHLGKTAWKSVTFADAETNHISIQTTDTSVRLHDCQALDELGIPLEKPIQRGEKIDGELDEESKTSERYLRHDSTPGRRKRIWIKCDLRLNRTVSLFLYLAMTVTAFGISLLIWRAVEGKASDSDSLHGLTAKDAAVVLIPVAFVASLLIAKESSTLTMRLRKLRQSVLLIELFILLGTALFLYVFHEIYAKP
ncbi:hypothetical protein [Streptomyces cyanogenus]|uniref:Uncharacterized protein n=1 Tax=Streptomyces cyanogenus TaxID=80860 RepID=A0ABX7TUB6_STRCY|nr:hypothetical protein [Streptomyces cyanogenus]QTD99123.1 hypothetical protein S1361_17365 [Streptomyces cyanogenus]